MPNLHLHNVPQEFYDGLRKAAALTTIKAYVIRAVQERMAQDARERPERRPARKGRAA